MKVTKIKLIQNVAESRFENVLNVNPQAQVFDAIKMWNKKIIPQNTSN